MTEKRALEDKNHDHSRENVTLRYFFDVFSCKVVFWLDSIVFTKASLANKASFQTLSVVMLCLAPRKYRQKISARPDVHENDRRHE